MDINGAWDCIPMMAGDSLINHQLLLGYMGHIWPFIHILVGFSMSNMLKPAGSWGTTILGHLYIAPIQVVGWIYPLVN